MEKTKILLPKSIKRTLKRLEEIYIMNLEEKRFYYDSISKNGKTYTGTDTIKIHLEDFEEFKSSLENGTSQLLSCEEGKEDEAKIRLMYAIWKWYDLLWEKDIRQIENDVYIKEDLKKRLKQLSNKAKTHEEALDLIDFINKATYSSWGQGDEEYNVKYFKLIESKEKFEKILKKFDYTEELTASEGCMVNYQTIRVAVVPVDRRTILIKKGILKEYRNFIIEHFNDKNYDNYIKMFDLWHDVRNTAIYCIYAPA